MESSIQPQVIETVLEERKASVSQSQGLIQKALDRLLEQLERGMTEEMQRYLQAMARFHKYSLSNQILIFTQCPHATHVAGFRTWQRFKRHVKKGEKGIKIIAPVWFQKELENTASPNSIYSNEEASQSSTTIFFRVQHVFDISQTQGECLPQPTCAQGDAQPWLPVIEKLLQSQNITLDYKPLGGAYGRSNRNKIEIQTGMSSAETFSTLAHELAHVMLHHGPDKIKINREEREWEADSVACVVCTRFGIDSIRASSDYILNWNGDKQALLNSLERIRITSDGIIVSMEKLVETNAS